MTDSGGTSLHLFLFSAGGVSFAIAAEQALKIAPYSGGGEGLFWFHEVLGFGGESVSYQAPTVVTIRKSGAGSCRVVVDLLEDIAEFSLNDIRAFPALLEPFTLQHGMWGILLRNDRMVLLVDIQRLLEQKGQN
jgi:hypothetical protein